jgi:hypothetical protein
MAIVESAKEILFIRIASWIDSLSIPAVALGV